MSWIVAYVAVGILVAGVVANYAVKADEDPLDLSFGEAICAALVFAFGVAAWPLIVGAVLLAGFGWAGLRLLPAYRKARR